MKDSIIESIKISKNFQAEFLTFRWNWKEQKLLTVVKGKRIEKKVPRKQDGASKLEEALQALQEKKKIM